MLELHRGTKWAHTLQKINTIVNLSWLEYHFQGSLYAQLQWVLLGRQLDSIRSYSERKRSTVRVRTPDKLSGPTSKTLPSKLAKKVFPHRKRPVLQIWKSPLDKIGFGYIRLWLVFYLTKFKVGSYPQCHDQALHASPWLWNSIMSEMEVPLP